jgi:hypothetical protein
MAVKTDILTMRMAKSPLFYLWLMLPASYPLQLLFSDYLTSESAFIPVTETASTYAVGIAAYLYGLTGFYTYETDTTRKQLLKCLLLLIGAVLLFVTFAWTGARWCYGIGEACS